MNQGRERMKYAVLALTIAFSATSQAVELNGLQIADTLPASEQQAELKLVDVASQNYYYLNDAYVGAVYQSSHHSHPERVEFIINSIRLSGRALGIQLYETMANQLDWEQYKALEPQMSTLVKMLNTRLEKGDRIIMHYSEQGGAEIFVKDKYKGSIASPEFFELATSAWLQNQSPMSTAVLAQNHRTPYNANVLEPINYFK